MQALQRGQAFSLAPRNFQDLTAMAEAVANSSFCPKAYQGKTADIMIAMQMGAELQLAPMQAIQNISVINGRPCVWGDALLAIVKGHPQFVDIVETVSEDGVATCIVKRQGQADTVATFSVADAKLARLWGKPGPWVQYPRRMLQMRARGFACRDAFPDALKGIMPAEEVRDYSVDAPAEPVDCTPMAERISAANTVAELEALLPDINKLGEAQKSELRPVFVARRNTLLAQEPGDTTKEEIVDPVKQLEELLKGKEEEDGG